MHAAHAPSLPHEPGANPLALRPLQPFAAVCALALAALGTVACTSRSVSQAPLPVSQPPASLASPSSSFVGDPSLPSAEQVLKGRTFDDGTEPAPTF